MLLAALGSPTQCHLSPRPQACSPELLCKGWAFTVCSQLGSHMAHVMPWLPQSTARAEAEPSWQALGIPAPSLSFPALRIIPCFLRTPQLYCPQTPLLFLLPAGEHTAPSYFLVHWAHILSSPQGRALCPCQAGTSSGALAGDPEWLSLPGLLSLTH